MKRNTECKGRWDDRFLCALPPPPSNPPQMTGNSFYNPRKRSKAFHFRKKKKEEKKGYKAIKYSYCLGNEPSFGTIEGSITLRFRLKFPVPKRLKVARFYFRISKGRALFFLGQLSPELIVFKCHLNAEMLAEKRCVSPPCKRRRETHFPHTHEKYLKYASKCSKCSQFFSL